MKSRFSTLITILVLVTGGAAHAEEVSTLKDRNPTQQAVEGPESQGNLNAATPGEISEKAPEQPKVGVSPPELVVNSSGIDELEQKVTRLETQISRLEAINRRQSTLLEKQEVEIHDLSVGLFETTRLLKELADHLNGNMQSNPDSTIMAPSPVTCEPNPSVQGIDSEQSSTASLPPNA